MNEYSVLDPRVYDSEEFYITACDAKEDADYGLYAEQSLDCPATYFTSTMQYDLVKAFMLKAGQEVHDVPSMPSDETIQLRARLIMEEALETIAALGCMVELDYNYAVGDDVLAGLIKVWPEEITKIRTKKYSNVDLTEIVDGCCDVMYVTLGTLISFGIQDCEYFDEVCYNNLSKVYPNCTKVDGKVQKPADYKPPRIKQMLENLFAVCKEHNLKDITPSLFNKPNE